MTKWGYGFSRAEGGQEGQGSPLLSFNENTSDRGAPAAAAPPRRGLHEAWGSDRDDPAPAALSMPHRS